MKRKISKSDFKNRIPFPKDLMLLINEKNKLFLDFDIFVFSSPTTNEQFRCSTFFNHFIQLLSHCYLNGHIIFSFVCILLYWYFNGV